MLAPTLATDELTEHAIPGQGIPLLADGDSNTNVDLEWALGVIDAGTPGLAARAAEVETVSGLIRDWFRKDTLDKIMGRTGTDTERIGRAWLLTGGKRWRPLLTASVFEVCGGEIARIREAAVAVECFHKASLVHDDIEDNDDERYGLPTVHNEYGVPAAINAGDYLIGEGYRLLAESDFSDAVRAEMVRVAAHGHRELCLGQGEELAFCRKPSSVSETAVLRIYERKTAAAFEVAVLLGAVAAGVDSETREQLSAFSRAAGIAYQIRDDIEDFRSVQGRAADMLSMRPTVFLAAACVCDHPGVGTTLDAVWGGVDPDARHKLIEAVSEAGLHRRVELLYAHYRNETERVLACVQHVGLNRLLRRITGRMFKR